VIKWLVVAKSLHGFTVERYWLRREATMWQVRASMQRDRTIVSVEVIEIVPAAEPEKEQAVVRIS
jgi:hypothetical protein